ncbi:MAG: sulfatase [Planctomycetota bacterium]|nr:sulfatase [Planctomycetota bacterium]
MDRRTRLAPRAGALALFAAVLASGCGSAPEPPRGVLLISIDSLRADHLSSYGYKSSTRPDVATSPAIDRLMAAQGVRFEEVVSTTSWTLPSHLAMLTGRPNELHGVQELPDRLPAEVPLLAEGLQAAGYRTAGFWSGPNLHPWFGFDRGFELYQDCSARPVEDPGVFALSDEEADHESVMSAHDDSHQGITGPRVIDAFQDWFSGVDEDEPFFAFVHLWDVHYDYTPPKEYDVFDPTYRGPIDGTDFQNLRIAASQKKDLARLISLYDGEILFTDKQVERLLTGLEVAGRLDDTLVILTSDHGEAFAEHRMLGHKHSLMDEELRVPLLMRLPGRIPAGRVVDDLASLVDIVPTIHDFTGTPVPPGTWGRSLAPIATGAVDDLEPRPAPIELTTRYNGRVQRGLRWQDDKFVDRGEGFRRVHLDLIKDPGEYYPVHENDADRPPIFGQRLAEAEDLWQRMDANRPRRGDSEALPTGLSDDLAAHGYMGDEEKAED